MTFTYTAILHGAMALLCFLSLAYVYFKRRPETHTVDEYFKFFLFFFLYNLFLAAGKTAFFYNFALLFLGIAAYYALRASLDFIFGASENDKKFHSLALIYLLAIIIITAFHFIYPVSPHLSPNGRWIFWRGADKLSLVYIFLMFSSGWLFSAGMLKGFGSLNSAIFKIRAIFLALGAFILPFAALFYFGAEKMPDIYLAFLFSILGLLFLGAGNFIIMFFASKTQQ